MTLPHSASYAEFEGNGVATQFPFSFRVWDAEHLRVLVTDNMGVSEFVRGWTVQITPDGGTLTYLRNANPLPEGYTLRIIRDMPFVQGVDLINGTRFDPQVIENALDIATAERQQLREAVERAVKVTSSDITPEQLTNEIRIAHAESVGAQASSHASALAAQNSQMQALLHEQASFAAQLCAQAWAEGTVPPDPDDSESKSAKTWAQAAERAVLASNVTPTPTPDSLPKSLASGRLDDGWIGASVAPVAGNIPRAHTNAKIDYGWTFPIGAVIPFAGSSAPDGFLLCDGAAVSRATYAELFATIGIAWGVGDGNTTFNIPNFTNRVIEGGTTSGSYKTAGLPNVTGYISFNVPCVDNGVGAFSSSIPTTGIGQGAASSQTKYYVANFSLKNGNDIYGKSTTVQMAAGVCQYIIKY